eukprot:s153_g47.t1
MACIGTKIGRDNKLTYQVKNKTITETDSSLPMPLQPFGCYENVKKAQDAVEEQVQKEVGRCPIEELSTSQKGEGTRYSWWTGKKQKDVKQLHDYKNENVEAMMKRTSVLMGASLWMSKLWLVMEAAGNTEDLEIKSVCAREVLDQIFEVGGLMPKVSQNLAMRPDLVKDDFIRNKLKERVRNGSAVCKKIQRFSMGARLGAIPTLKTLCALQETQNANPSRDEKGTMDYVSKHNPSVPLPNIEGTVPLLDLLEYKKALSAGSVGQVDLFTLKKDIKEEWRTAFKKMLPSYHGDTVIVKTVFEETEEAYQNDWALLELFFTNCGDKCETWTCL